LQSAGSHPQKTAGDEVIDLAKTNLLPRYY
jgi:hypothetical protein